MKCITLYPVIFIIINLFGHSYSIFYDYYWRDYTGDIPYDAIKGGTDKNNRTTYIGQVFIKDGGIIPVTIYPGRRSVVANIFKLHTTEDYIKILCSSSEENFKWFPATNRDLHLQFIGKHLVRGGVEYGLVTNIGRVLYQSEIIVGKVCGFSIGKASMYFPYKNEEKRVDSYEVLVYESDRRQSLYIIMYQKNDNQKIN